MSNSIGFEGTKFYVNTNNGVQKVSGNRLTGTLDGIAVRTDNGESSATDTASGLCVCRIKGTQDELVKLLVDKGYFDKLSEMRKTDKYTDMCFNFGKKVEEFKQNESKEKKSTSKSVKKSSSKSSKKSDAKVDFEIKKGTRDGAFEVYFTSKPSRSVLDSLKAIGFHWNPKKLCWYGFKDKATVEKAVKVA